MINFLNLRISHPHRKVASSFLTDVYERSIFIHMKNLRRKQFILPQDKLNAVRKTLRVKTDTEAVILSLDAVLRRKKLQELANLAGKVKLGITVKDLLRMRRDRD